MTAPSARIHERGYRRYDGPRYGELHAMRCLMLFTFQRILGFRRPARNKIVPAVLIGLAYLPAVVFIGLAAFLPARIGDAVVPSYTGYYGFVSSVILLLVGYSAPEAFGADRRSRALSLYLAAPLTRATYLLSQGAAIAASVAAVTIGAPLLLVGGLAIQGVGQNGLGDVAIAVVRIVAAGGAMAVFYACVSAGLSSLTDRRAIGSGAIILAVFLTNGLSVGLVLGGGAPGWVRLFGIGNAMNELVLRIFGVATPYMRAAEEGGPVLAETATLAAAGAAIAWAVAGAALAWWRYQRMQVTR